MLKVLISQDMLKDILKDSKRYGIENDNILF